MLRISKLTDYGVVLSTTMAERDPGHAHTARDLAQATGIPEPTVSKVLKRLTREGILVSQRGVRGGYRLARSSSDMTVAEVITALEGPISVTECSGREFLPGCEYEGRCKVQTSWQRINEAIKRALAGISLAEMALAPQPLLVQLTVSSVESHDRATNGARDRTNVNAPHDGATDGGLDPAT